MVMLTYIIAGSSPSVVQNVEARRQKVKVTAEANICRPTRVTLENIAKCTRRPTVCSNVSTVECVYVVKDAWKCN